MELLNIQIGITGHRAICLEDLPAIKDEVRHRLLALKMQYQAKSLCLFSGLAEGADRLVVEVGLELGIPFVGILPMAVSDYLSDFKTQLSRDEFEYLLTLASRIEILSKLPVLTNEDRLLCYQQLAVYLAQNSAVLLALWDGDPTEKSGGTSQVVRYFKEANMNKEASLVHVITRRCYS